MVLVDLLNLKCKHIRLTVSCLCQERNNLGLSCGMFTVTFVPVIDTQYFFVTQFSQLDFNFKNWNCMCDISIFVNVTFHSFLVRVAIRTRSHVSMEGGWSPVPLLNLKLWLFIYIQYVFLILFSYITRQINLFLIHPGCEILCLVSFVGFVLLLFRSCDICMHAGIHDI